MAAARETVRMNLNEVLSIRAQEWAESVVGEGASVSPQ